MRRWLHLAALALPATVLSLSCSLQNQEGPAVTCEMLDCGRVNACQEGIIAQCVDGHTVKYRVCAVTDICTADWQVRGQYRCELEDTDCEGCRPERTLGCEDPLFGDGGGGAGGGAGGGNGTGGSGGAGGSGG